MTDHALKISITDAMKDAMRAKDKPRLSTVRLMLSELKRIEVDERIDLPEDRIISILDKMIKQRRDSVKQYTDGDRLDLADIESAEIEIIQEFMPAAMSEEEITAIVNKAITDSGAATMQDMGKVMNEVRPLLAGRADMAVVSKLVKQLLS
ncbi:MAG: GatB/YqeY domain-containing protein [Gammaproteobacteria bacterium]|nr:GatB/YqeY domain-containing protein [Gammaproteobacteria bacterium]